MTPKALIIEAVLHQTSQQLSPITDSPMREARLLLGHVLGESNEWVFTHGEHLLTTKNISHYNALLARRMAQEPLSRIIGTREFYGEQFHISPAVLDPRPDSETIIEALLDQLPDTAQPYRIADLGTGSGCLLLTALRLYSNTIGIGVEYSVEALKIAQQNLAHHAALDTTVRARTMLINSTWGAALAPHSLDIVISNPPYIEENANLPVAVAKHDPAIALFAGEDGLDCYQHILEEAPHYLKPGGLLLLELGAGQRHAVQQLAMDNGFQQCHAYQDLGGVERVLVCEICSAEE